MSRLGRVAAGGAGIVLLGTAALHATAYPAVAQWAAAAPADPLFQRAAPGLWLFFAWHLVIIGVATLWLAGRAYRQASPLLAVAALVTAGDTVWVFALAGFFVGTALLAVAAVLLAVASVQRPGTTLGGRMPAEAPEPGHTAAQDGLGGTRAPTGRQSISRGPSYERPSVPDGPR